LNKEKVNNETKENSYPSIKNAGRLKSKISYEEIHSPAIEDKYLKKLPKAHLDSSMKNSSKLHMK
jgi:hypothetical protein